MTLETREQGRYPRGRVPDGYRFVDAGPDPMIRSQAEGRRMRHLNPDPVTGAHVKWMSTQRLAGTSIERIATTFNDKRVPCLAERRGPRRSL